MNPKSTRPGPFHWGALLVLLSASGLPACGSETGSGSDEGMTSTNGAGRGDPTGSGGSQSGDDSQGVPTTAQHLDGQPCESGQDVVDECSSCLCGESGTYSCIFVPGCEIGDSDSTPQPSGPDEIEGQPCDGTKIPSFQCAACFCTDAGTYSCAVIANCETFLDACESQPEPETGCEGGWICNESQWMCLDDPDCPKMAQLSDVLCSTEIVERVNPQTDTCCAYASPCDAPSTWEACGEPSGSRL